jgi:hypothetical protein
MMLHIEHSSNLETSSEQATSISFGLGDPDDGDEFVVDIYHDPQFGSFQFETIGGQSRCVHEDKTLPGEEPQITIESIPSKSIFPDDDITFSVTLANLGEHVYSYFYLGQDGNSPLPVRPESGFGRTQFGYEIMLKKNQRITREISISRGSGKYEFEPVNLVFRSACETELDNIKPSSQKEVSLWNAIDSNGKRILKWLEPCPPVRWAGQLQRDRSFLVNTESASSSIVRVDIRNPSSGSGKKMMDMTGTGGRLEHVYLLYRKLDTITWKNALLKSGDKLDFVSENVEETDSGYLDLNWYVGQLPDGEYEIVLESQCTDVGGIDEFNFHQENIMKGIIDFSRPQEFGKAIPLSDNVLIGQEITIVFTEPLDCSLPLSFNIEMHIKDSTDIILDKDDLLIVCEGRRISFQPDLTRIIPSVLNGKEFEVTIGSVKDFNGNARDPNAEDITINKKFGEVDIHSASTTFTFRMGNTSCINGIDDTIESEKSKDEVRSKIASLIGYGTNRTDSIIIQDISCQNKDTLIAAVELVPNTTTPGTRRLGTNNKFQDTNNKGDSSFEAFEKLKEAIHVDVDVDDTTSSAPHLNGRQLSHSLSLSEGQFEITSVRIIPDTKNMKKFETPPSKLKEEAELHLLAFADDANADTNAADGSQYSLKDSELIFKLEKDKQNEINSLQSIEESLRKDLQKEKEQLRDDREKEKEQLRDDREKEKEELQKKSNDMEILEQSLRKEKEELRTERETERNEMKTMFMIQGAIIFVGCSLATLAIVLQVRR